MQCRVSPFPTWHRPPIVPGYVMKPRLRVPNLASVGNRESRKALREIPAISAVRPWEIRSCRYQSIAAASVVSFSNSFGDTTRDQIFAATIRQFKSAIFAFSASVHAWPPF